jgi:hypothetical protein
MKLDLRCSAHRRYQAKRYPRSECKVCVMLFWLSHNQAVVIEYTDKNGYIYLENKRN